MIMCALVTDYEQHVCIENISRKLTLTMYSVVSSSDKRLLKFIAVVYL